MDHNITNEQFLQAIFGDNYAYTHVTDFPDDPSAISNDRKGICWAGDYYHRYHLTPDTNQFFCISQFNPQPDGRSRRTKHNHHYTYVITVDDVNEKIPPDRIAMMQPPSIVVMTSMYSEQWHYILAVPESDRKRVDNLLDGLVSKGLAPDGKDPGMRGVTRYVRLPNGVNSKAKRIAENGGTPYPCNITVFEPQRRYTLEELGATFGIDVDADRPNDRTDGAVDMPDHPVLQHMNIKSTLGPGRYDVTCPWLDDHTDRADDGAAVFTNDDSTVGFMCHHGHCQDKRGSDLVDWIDKQHPGFRAQYRSWVTTRSVDAIFDKVNPKQTPRTFMTAAEPQKYEQPALQQQPQPVTAAVPLVNYQHLMDNIRREMPGSALQLAHCEILLRALDPVPHGEKLVWYDQVQHAMGWSKSDLQKVVTDYRKTWYEQEASAQPFYKEMVYISSMNMFYHKAKRLFLSMEAFQNTFNHLDEDARKTALAEAKSKKVDAMDYLPGQPEIYVQDDVEYINSWDGRINYGKPGPLPLPWIDHFDVLGWADYRETMMQFMAHTILKPHSKINWAMVLGGAEGVGKDFLLYPLVRAMGQHANIVQGEELTSQFNEYLLHKKYIHFNEVELGDHSEAARVVNKLKPIITAPPERLTLNIKGLRGVKVSNIFNITIATNSYHPLKVDENSRRYFMLWTNNTIRNEAGQVTAHWRTYWEDAWDWMLDESEGGQGGWRQCAYYLVNKVSLEDFNPKSPPMVTEYMRELQEMSQSPVTEEINNLIKDNIGIMAADLVTVRDVLSAIKFETGNTYRNLTAVMIGRVLGEMGYRDIIRAGSKKLYVLRQPEKYMVMSVGDVLTTYNEQRAKQAPDNSNVVSFFSKRA